MWVILRYKEPGEKDDDEDLISKIRQKLNDFNGLQNEIFKDDQEINRIEGRISEYINKYSD